MQRSSFSKSVIDFSKLKKSILILHIEIEKNTISYSTTVKN